MAENNHKPLTDLLASLAQPVPESFLSTKSSYSKGQESGKIKYIAWPALIRLLDARTGGFWEWKVRTIYAGDRFVVEGSLTVCGCDGSITREATGTELSDVDSFGDPTSNAEAMALRRACAKFGIGLELWDKKVGKQSGWLTKEEWQAKFGGKG
jgi:hypothetical protein